MSNNNMERKAILTEPPVDFWCKTKDVVDVKFRAAWTIERFSERPETNTEVWILLDCFTLLHIISCRFNNYPSSWLSNYQQPLEAKSGHHQPIGFGKPLEFGSAAASNGLHAIPPIPILSCMKAIRGCSRILDHIKGIPSHFHWLHWCLDLVSRGNLVAAQPKG